METAAKWEVRAMYSKCPGQDFRKLRVELYKCPNCGAEVEIFSDENKVKCHNCGKNVFREKLPSCIEWCASARQCLGEERWKQLRGEEKDDNSKKENS
jgi:DNA-directed RNA polymerase subunit RPC12/RpoP